MTYVETIRLSDEARAIYLELMKAHGKSNITEVLEVLALKLKEEYFPVAKEAPKKAPKKKAKA